MKFKFKYRVDYNKTKNLILKETRGISFDDILVLISKGGVLDDKKHHNPQKHPNQKVLVVKTENYTYAVPYVVDDKRKIVFLKTAYPSHELTKKYSRK